MQGVEVGEDDRLIEVRVGVSVAVTGEVLGAGGHGLGRQALDIGHGVASDDLGVGAEAARPDDGVVVRRVDVNHRRKIQTDPVCREVCTDAGRAAPRGRDVVQPSEDGVARLGGAAGEVQAGDVAALLVHGDEQGRRDASQASTQAMGLRSVGDVAPVEADGAQPTVNGFVDPCRHRRPDKAGHEGARSEGA
jgi:hypothetical protein